MKNKLNFLQKDLLYVLFLIIFIMASNIIWLKIDTTPQRWDESIHLNAASDFARTLKTHPLQIFKTFITQESFYPPLVPFLGAFFGLINPEQDNFTYVMILFHVLLIIFVFLYTKKIFDVYSAVCAATIVVTFPLIYGEGHFFMFDLPLTSFVIMAAYFLLLTDNFSNKKYTFMFFISCGLGMLIKWTFLFYIIVPFLFYVFQNKTSLNKGQKSNLTFGILIFLVIFLPWYVYNITTTLPDLLGYSFKRGKIEGQPDVFSIESLLYYIKILPDQITLPFFILFLISLIFIFFDKKNNKLILFFLIPFLFFTFLGNKKNRYIMPLLPFIAIIISYLLCILRQDIYKKLLLSAIIVFSLVNYVYSTYSLPVKWKHSNRPISENWHVKDFLDKIETDKNVTLAIVPDHPHMNNALYSFYAKNFKNNVKIMGIYNFPMGTDYFLIKTGDLGPFFSGLEKRKQILEKIQDPLSDVSMIYEKIFETELPDGSTGSLYKIKSNIKINKKTFESEIYSNINYLLNRYLKNAESLKITVQGESNAGNNLMNKIIIECKRGFAGDFKHKDAGLYLNNVQMEIDGILINPYALRSNSLEIIHLDKITVKSLEINGEDLKNFAGYYVKGIENLNFNFENNLINISASYKKIPLFVSVYLYNPNPYKDNSDVCFKLKKIRIGFIPIPTSFINFLLKDYNPLLVKSNPFFKVNFGEIKTEGNKLCIR